MDSKPRYRVKAYYADPDNSANVIDTRRKNEWGEPWVERVGLTWEEARRIAAYLNACERVGS